VEKLCHLYVGVFPESDGKFHMFTGGDMRFVGIDCAEAQANRPVAVGRTDGRIGGFAHLRLVEKEPQVGNILANGNKEAAEFDRFVQLDRQGNTTGIPD